MGISCSLSVWQWENLGVGLTTFSLVAANVLFFWGLGIYIRVKRGWAIAWAAASGAAMLGPAGWEVLRPETPDVWSGAGPAALALVAAVLAVLHFWQSLERPDQRGTGLLLMLQAGMAGGAAAAVWTLEWPLRF